MKPYNISYRILFKKNNTKSKGPRLVSVFVNIALLYQLLFPNISYALSGGPTSPDFASFEPVATTNLVNEFTGQLTYNIPVIEIPGTSGGGYAMSLSYHSGDGPDDEASWVGHGWTLNAGSINRMNRGVPDDYKGKGIQYYNDVPTNWTIALTSITNLQALSILGTYVGIGSQTSARYNNYKGFSIAKNVYISVLNGMVSYGLTATGGDASFSWHINPGAALSAAAGVTSYVGVKTGNSVGMAVNKALSTGAGQSTFGSVSSTLNKLASMYKSYSAKPVTTKTLNTPYDFTSISGSFMVTGEPIPFVQAGASLGGIISYAQQKNRLDNGDYNLIPAYGYMYSGDATSNDEENEDCIMDYTSERSHPYNLEDFTMPIPTSTPDAFMVAGEGIGGSFRMYNDRVGIFSPNYTRGEGTKYHFGFDLHVGLSFGFGMDVGVSKDFKGKVAKKLKKEAMGYEEGGLYELENRSSWYSGSGTPLNGNTDDFTFAKYNENNSSSDLSEPVFFRFDNDPGGSVTYDDNDNYIVPVANDFYNHTPYLPYDLKLNKDEFVPGVRRNGRASYVGYRTIGDMQKKSATNKRLYSAEKNEKILQMAGVDNTSNYVDDFIGEVYTFAQNGNKYVYGLPVFARQEEKITRGVITNTTPAKNRYWTEGSLNSKTKVGTINSNPYITSYLLTQITTPEYIDVNLNGPDEADIGGYTRFTYRDLHAGDFKNSNDSMFRWRVPFKGYYYINGRNASPYDNMGSYQSGYKEIYVLDSIHTKTHFAVFKTNEREDGFSAMDDNELAAQGDVPDFNDAKKMEKLRKIELYAKNPNGNKLIKTVYFQYEYEAWPGVFNSNAGGKLTLKRMWFEYNGVVNASISPYEFEYNYPTVQYPAKYQFIQDEWQNAGLNENPDYSPHLDCWGNYQQNGVGKRNEMRSWVYQKQEEGFDPAAWQLKRIILPSGGEIHIQYEQHTYSHVQDKDALAMVKLLDYGDDADNNYANYSLTGENKRYYLDFSDTEIDPQNSADLDYVIKKMKELFLNKGRQSDKIYYKFFYSLHNKDENGINSCDGEFIDGFAQVRDVGLQGNDVYVELLFDPPKKMCQGYVKNVAGGALFGGDCSSPDEVMQDPRLFSKIEDWTNKEGKRLVQSFLRTIKLNVLGKKHFCRAVNPGLSYFRIPVKKKRGGGVRVKRLMMYNAGVDADAQTLFGTEYIYENPVTGESYGVATNEPYENPENPMIDYFVKYGAAAVPRVSPFVTTNILYQGRDDEHFKGPLSRNLLPAASIGYSQVIKKPIFQDKYTGTGFTVIRYHTVKDYPFSDGISYSIPRYFPVMDNDLHLFSYVMEHQVKRGQGYLFKKNDMHGQLKSITDYPGEFTDGFFNPVTIHTPVQQVSHSYYEPGEKVPMYNFDTWSVSLEDPAKESDITIERQASNENVYEIMNSWDIVNFVPYGAFFISGVSTDINQIVTNKVIHYPAVKKATVVIKYNGSTDYPDIENNTVLITENLGFDKYTMQPVLVSTRDGYYGIKNYSNPTYAHNEVYKHYSVPASSQYPSMRQKAFNERHYYMPDNYNIYTSIGPDTGTAPILRISPFNDGMTSAFSPGDLISIEYSSGSLGIANVVGVYDYNVINQLKVVPASRYNLTLPNGQINKIEVVSSGYTNQLDASAGSFLQYGDRKSDKYSNPVNNPTINWMAGVQRINKALDSMVWGGLPGDTFVAEIKDLAQHLVMTDSNMFCAPPSTHIVGYVKFTFNFNSSTGLNEYYVAAYDTSNVLIVPANIGIGTNSWEDITVVVNGLLATPPPVVAPDGYYIVNHPIILNRPILVQLPNTWQPANGKPGILTGFQSLHDTTFVTMPWVWCKKPKDGGNNVDTADRYEELDAVLRATAITYNDDWYYDSTAYLDTNLNDYESGRKGKWRPYETYVFSDTTIKGSNPSKGQRVYKYAGASPNFIKGPYELLLPMMSGYWNKLNTITRYSPNGTPVEEKNSNYVYSAARYTFDKNIPYILAKNAQHRSLRFLNFENVYNGNRLNDGVYINSSDIISGGHTGNNSYQLNQFAPLEIKDVFNQNGYFQIRFWAKVATADYNSILQNTDVKKDGTLLPVKHVTRTGEWALFEAIAEPPHNDTVATFEFVSNNNDPVQIDDIRIIPWGADATSYVYDMNSYRLDAVLDDHHFATFYQYNSEGKLIRKLQETERGIRVVEESHQNIPKNVNRDAIGNY